MKKFLALVMVAAMMLSCVAFAEDAKDPMEIDRTVFKLENDWVGEWKLSAAYVTEEGIDECELEGVEAGAIAVTPGAVTMNIEAAMDHCASGGAGTMVDQAAYIHATVYCLTGTLKVADHPEEVFTLDGAWKDFGYFVRGENDGEFNYGPVKVAIRAEDKSYKKAVDFLHWDEITGIEIEDGEEFGHIFMNTSGQLVLCGSERIANKYAEDGGLHKKQKSEVYIAYIFDKVVEEVPAAE